MRERIISFAFTLSLIIVLGAVIMINMFSFVSGPMIIQKETDEKVVSQFNSNYKLNGTTLLNRFSFDAVYYIMQNEHTIYVTAKNGIKIIEEGYHEVYDTVYSYIQEQGLTDVEITYGFYHNELVYVLVNENVEVYLSYEDASELFVFRKGSW